MLSLEVLFISVSLWSMLITQLMGLLANTLPSPGWCQARKVWRIQMTEFNQKRVYFARNGRKDKEDTHNSHKKQFLLLLIDISVLAGARFHLNVPGAAGAKNTGSMHTVRTKTVFLLNVNAINTGCSNMACFLTATGTFPG